MPSLRSKNEVNLIILLKQRKEGLASRDAHKSRVKPDPILHLVKLKRFYILKKARKKQHDQQEFAQIH